jgi:hypothetical protein
MPGEAVEKHAGPGPHPGTGTPQSVHGGGAIKPYPEKTDWLAVLESAATEADAPAKEPVTILDYSAQWYDWAGKDGTIQSKRAFLDFFAVDGYQASLRIQELPAVDNEEALLTVYYNTADGEYAGKFDIVLTKSKRGTIVVNEDFYRDPETGISSLSWVNVEVLDKDLYNALRGRLEPENLSKQLGWPHLKVETEPADERWFSEREMRLIEEYPSNERRKEVKRNGETHLINDTDWPQAGSFQKEWARHSNDDGNASDWLQHEAWERAGKTDSISVTKGMKMYDGIADAKTREITAKAYDSIYRRTQQYFADRGFGPDDEIVIYRGVALAKQAYPDVAESLLGEEIRIKPRPLQSFSTSVAEASKFAGDYNKYPGEFGLVIGVRVPVKDVFAHWSTGMGCMTEDEMIVKGSHLAKTPVEVVRIWRR